jgi:excisionase family DNA binding protein
MTTIHPGITGRAIDIGEYLEPLGVSPRQACILLNVGRTYVYELIGNGELESYREGGARKITMRSIRARHERQLAAARGTDLATEASQPRYRRHRRRRRKAQPTEART